MTECIAQLRLSFYQPKPVEVTFDAPVITSNGGAILLRQVDDQLGLSTWFAAALPEPRDATRTTHDRREQVRHRLYGDERQVRLSSDIRIDASCRLLLFRIARRKRSSFR